MWHQHLRPQDIFPHTPQGIKRDKKFLCSSYSSNEMSYDFKSSTYTISLVSNRQLYLTMGKGDIFFWNMTGNFLHKASLEFRKAVKAECYMGWRGKRWEKKEMWTKAPPASPRESSGFAFSGCMYTSAVSLCSRKTSHLRVGVGLVLLNSEAL